MLRLNSNFKIDNDLSVNVDSENLIIKGDSKNVLPALLESYESKIKCAYIDPPYNNGDKYLYYSDSISHQLWLDGIRAIVEQIKELLTEDGSIWVSIDDSEMCYLKIMMDEVFGKQNFTATIVWQHRTTRENRRVFSYNHEYILVYSKDIKKFKKSRNLLPFVDNKILDRYKNPDNDPRGPWQSTAANVQGGHGTKSQFYTLIAPNGKKHNPPKGRCWIYTKERMEEEIRLNNIWFGKTGNNAPRVKKFLKNAKMGLTPQTLWLSAESGTTESAKKHLKKLFTDIDEDLFDTPKPENLISRIFTIATNEGDIILDCFLGSGTSVATAHKMHRKYIGVELGQQAETLVVPRMNKVINGENGGVSDTYKWQGGGDYAFYRYIDSNNK